MANKIIHCESMNIIWRVVGGPQLVAQLVEWSIPTPEICASNPVIGKFYLLSTVFKRRKEKEWPIFLKKQDYLPMKSRVLTKLELR